MTELKPCPFCGGEAKITDSARGQYKHRVQCTRCGVSSPGTAYRNDSWNTRQWNTRADDWLTREEFEATGYEGQVWVCLNDDEVHEADLIRNRTGMVSILIPLIEIYDDDEVTHVMIRQQKPEPPEGE